MPLIYITGIAGSGKSIVLKELIKKGYEVEDADEELSSWENKVTRERVSASDHRLTTDSNFFKEHDWYMNIEGLERLAETAKNKTIFLGGSVANEKEIWKYFDEVFCLYVDDETLKRRINSRTDKNFGKSEHELDHLLKLNERLKSKYTSLGAILIDATQPIDKVVNSILEAVS